MDYEKQDPAREPSTAPTTEPQVPATADSKNETTVEDRAAAASTHSGAEIDEEDGVEYPKAWRLGVITIALCLSVFCMALVR